MSNLKYNRTKHSPEDGLFNLIGKSYDAYRCTDLYGFRTDRRMRFVAENGLITALCAALKLKKPDQDPNKLSRMTQEINGFLENVQVNLYPIEGWDSSCTPVEIVIRIQFRRETAPISENRIILLPIREQPQSDVFCSYPLILVRAKSVVWKTTSLWLKKTYDCHILELQISPKTLTSIVEWWSSHLFDVPPGEKERVEGHGQRFTKFELEFQVPSTNGISSFTVSMSVPDLLSLYGIAKASASTLTDVIHAHVYNTMKVKLETFVLIRIGTPIVYLDASKSKLKLFPNTPKEHVIRMLEDLCEAIIQDRNQDRT